MADRSGPDAQRVALDDLRTAIADYLEAWGFAGAIGIGNPQIRTLHGNVRELVVQFTGGKHTDEAER